jgi:2,4-dienoyl-CoA reductase-like NADH-dependent reductase (Old Yellow Enzyme family)
MIGAWSAERVGVRLSPSSFLYGVDDSDKLATFGHVVRALDAMRIGYICLLEPNAKDAERGVQIERVAATFRPMTSLPIIVNTGFDKARANAVLAGGDADLVAFGVPTSPIPTWSLVFAPTRRSTSRIRRNSMVRDPRVMPIIRRLQPSRLRKFRCKWDADLIL